MLETLNRACWLKRLKASGYRPFCISILVIDDALDKPAKMLPIESVDVFSIEIRHRFAIPQVNCRVISRDVWNLWEVVYDFKTQTFNVLINNSLVAANEPFLNPATAFGTGLFDTFNASEGNDLGYIDNYSITGAAVPEPGSFVLLVTSCLILLISTKVKSRRPLCIG